MNFMFSATTNTLTLKYGEEVIGYVFYNARTEMPQTKEEVNDFMDQLHRDALLVLEQANVKMEAVVYSKNMADIQLTIDRLFTEQMELKAVELAF